MIHFYVEAENGHGMDWGTQGERYAISCDGLGGLGPSEIKHPDGRTWDESKVASYYAGSAIRDLIECRLSQWDLSIRKDIQGTVQSIANEMEQTVRAAVKKAEEEWVYDLSEDEPDNQKQHYMATTISVWIVFPADNGKTLALAIWAGDSRCYTIDADEMRLFTEDDVAEHLKADAMEETFLSGSPQMNNRVGLDLDWHLNTQMTIIEKPTLLFACTDGVYGCQWIDSSANTPIHMEKVLRLCGKAAKLEDLQAALANRVEGRMDDDSATFMSIFVDPENSGFAGLCNLLTAGLPAVEEILKQYPAALPKEMPFVQEGDEINRIKRKLLSSPFFADALKEDSENYVRGMEPAGEYAQLLTQLKPLRDNHLEYAIRTIQEEKESEIRQGKAEIESREKELDYYLGKLTYQETQNPSLPLSVVRQNELMSQFVEEEMSFHQQQEIQGEIRDTLDGIARDIDGLFGGNDWRRNEAQKHLKKGLPQIDKALFRLIYWLQEIDEKQYQFQFTHINVPIIGKSKNTELNEAQKKALKNVFLAGNTPDELIADVQLSPQQCADLIKICGKIQSIRTKIKQIQDRPADLSRQIPLSVTEKAQIAQIIESSYLQEGEARYYIKKWVSSGNRPATLQLLENKEEVLQLAREVTDLIDKLRLSKESVEKKANYKKQALELWRKLYKEHFEAWKLSESIPADFFGELLPDHQDAKEESDNPETKDKPEAQKADHTETENNQMDQTEALICPVPDAEVKTELTDPEKAPDNPEQVLQPETQPDTELSDCFENEDPQD